MIIAVPKNTDFHTKEEVWLLGLPYLLLFTEKSTADPPSSAEFLDHWDFETAPSDWLHNFKQDNTRKNRTDYFMCTVDTPDTPSFPIFQ